MANYSYVGKATYQPMTYDELSKPLVRMAEEQNAIQEAYAKYQEEAMSLEKALENEPESEAYQNYKKFIDTVTTAEGLLNREGVNNTSRAVLMAARRNYAKNVAPTAAAFEIKKTQSNQQEKERAQDRSVLFTRDAADTSIDKYVKNPALSYQSLSRNAITADVGNAAQAINDKFIGQDYANVAKVLGNEYVQVEQYKGMTPIQILMAIKKEGNLSDAGVKLLQEIKDEGIRKSGFYNWDIESQVKNQNAVEAAAELGLWNAAGKDNLNVSASWKEQNASSLTNAKDLEDYKNPDVIVLDKDGTEKGTVKRDDIPGVPIYQKDGKYYMLEGTKSVAPKTANTSGGGFGDINVNNTISGGGTGTIAGNAKTTQSDNVNLFRTKFGEINPWDEFGDYATFFGDLPRVDVTTLTPSEYKEYEKRVEEARDKAKQASGIDNSYNFNDLAQYGRRPIGVFIRTAVRPSLDAKGNIYETINENDPYRGVKYGRNYGQLGTGTTTSNGKTILDYDSHWGFYKKGDHVPGFMGFNTSRLSSDNIGNYGEVKFYDNGHDFTKNNFHVLSDYKPAVDSNGTPKAVDADGNPIPESIVWLNQLDKVERYRGKEPRQEIDANNPAYVPMDVRMALAVKDYCKKTYGMSDSEASTISYTIAVVRNEGVLFGGNTDESRITINGENIEDYGKNYSIVLLLDTDALDKKYNKKKKK